MKRVVGVTYDNGVVCGLTVDGIIDDKTDPADKVEFARLIQAHWEYKNIFDPHCSNCGYAPDSELTDYCPECGAKMTKWWKSE